MADKSIIQKKAPKSDQYNPNIQTEEPVDKFTNAVGDVKNAIVDKATNDADNPRGPVGQYIQGQTNGPSDSNYYGSEGRPDDDWISKNLGIDPLTIGLMRSHWVPSDFDTYIKKVAIQKDIPLPQNYGNNNGNNNGNKRKGPIDIGDEFPMPENTGPDSVQMNYPDWAKQMLIQRRGLNYHFNPSPFNYNNSAASGVLMGSLDSAYAGMQDDLIKKRIENALKSSYTRPITDADKAAMKKAAENEALKRDLAISKINFMNADADYKKKTGNANVIKANKPTVGASNGPANMAAVYQLGTKKS